MDRKGIDTRIKEIDLQPIAAPVQSFVDPGPSPLRGLAAGLSKFDTGLKAFEDARAQKQAEDDKLRGQAEFYRDHDGTMAEAVAAGKIPAQWSPSFVAGFKASQGDVRGTNLQAAFQADYDAWQGKNSDDPHAYETFVQDWMSKNVGPDEDPRVLRTLIPHIGAAVTQGSNRYIEDRHKLVYGGAVDATIAGAGQDVDKAVTDGLAVPEGTNYPALWESIQQRREAAIATGIRPDDLDLSLLQTMSAKILTTRDPELLKFFDQKVPGKDYTYGESPDGIKIKKETIDSLDVINRRNLSDEAEATKAASKAASDAAEAEAGDLLAGDPSKPLPEELIARGSKYDGGFRAKVEGWRDTFGKRMPSDNGRVDAVYKSMYEAAEGGGDPEKIWRDASTQGVFTNPEDASKALTMAKALASSKDDIKTVFDDQSYKTIEKVIAGRTQGVDSFAGDPMVGLSNEGLEAQYDLRQKATKWALTHPNATDEERAAAISTIGKGILESLVAPADGPAADNGTGLVYDRDTKQMSFPNPYSPKPTDPAAPQPSATPTLDATQKPPASTAAPGSSLKDWFELPSVDGIKRDFNNTFGSGDKAPAADPEVGDFLNGLEPAQRKSMDERAKAFGKTTEEFVKQLLAPKADQQSEAFKPISYTQTANDNVTAAGNPRMTQQIATKLIDDSLMEQAVSGEGARSSRTVAYVPDDPKAARLLDLIVQHEAAGNWNAVYGNSRSKVNLGKFSLNQILSMQVAARARGVASTAIGGGQFIYKTLRGLKEEMSLTGSEKFTPKLQTALMMHLLERRGYSAFKAGKLSKRAFALRLAQEWASLPDPRTGRSVYAGDGLNASSAKPGRVLAELGLIAA